MDSPQYGLLPLTEAADVVQESAGVKVLKFLLEVKQSLWDGTCSTRVGWAVSQARSHSTLRVAQAHTPDVPAYPKSTGGDAISSMLGCTGSGSRCDPRPRPLPAGHLSQ